MLWNDGSSLQITEVRGSTLTGSRVNKFGDIGVYLIQIMHMIIFDLLLFKVLIQGVGNSWSLRFLWLSEIL